VELKNLNFSQNQEFVFDATVKSLIQVIGQRYLDAEFQRG
jgi:hypothetical protein